MTRLITFSFERKWRVLRLAFSGLLTPDDLDAIDPLLVQFLAVLNHERQAIRCLFDLSQVTALAVSQARFRERASKPAIGDVPRVVVAPQWADAGFGRSYREAEGHWPHAQPVIVSSAAAGHAWLGMTDVEFEPLVLTVR